MKPAVLIVDDDPGLLELLRIRLQSFGFETHSANNGRDALTLMEQNPINVVVTDLRMEPMDGMALFEKIHQRNPAIPVIMLTAHGTIREAVEATHKGVFAFLTKPVNKDELQSTLNKAVDIQPSISNEPASLADTKLKTRSAKMFQLLEQAKLYADSDVNILVTGESGTGKELLADIIHSHSDRADYPFVAINCSAIPHELLESELFGHIKGAFTGATQNREGLFTSANGGTVLLDEIGDMPYALQAKLLRVLQEKKVRPVGGREDLSIDIRVISATHIDLASAINAKEFREDLFYRLNVVNLHIPPLRERIEDIPMLADHFLAEISTRNGKPGKSLAPDAIGELLSFHWPGNIRQLQNVMERLFALSRNAIISKTQVQEALPIDTPLKVDTLSDAKKDFERQYIVQLLTATEGKMTLAAEISGRNRSDFHKLVKRHNLDPNEYRNGKAGD